MILSIRILLRLRSVFARQCFAWMVYGLLEDPSDEFLVRLHHSRHSDPCTERDNGNRLNGRIAQLLRTASADEKQPAEDQGERFSWASSCSLRLLAIPHSHVTSNMAVKILFAGKAVRLMQAATAGSLGLGQGDKFQRGSSGAVHQYLSGGAAAASSLKEARRTHSEMGMRGYSIAEVALFGDLFTQILRQPQDAVRLLESAVDRVNDAISARLWRLLRDELDFSSHLQLVRNTYLLGKGELFQSVLDGVEAATHSRLGSVAMSSAEQDSHLNWHILRSTAKLLGLDDETMLRTLRLRADSCSVDLSDFGTHVHLGSVSCTGGALLATAATTVVESAAELPSIFTGVALTSASPVAGHDCGAVWLVDRKHVSRGFFLSAEFACDWGRARAAAGAMAGASTYSVAELGAMQCCLHGDAKLLEQAEGDAVKRYRLSELLPDAFGPGDLGIA